MTTPLAMLKWCWEFQFERTSPVKDQTPQNSWRVWLADWLLTHFVIWSFRVVWPKQSVGFCPSFREPNGCLSGTTSCFCHIIPFQGNSSIITIMMCFYLLFVLFFFEGRFQYLVINRHLIFLGSSIWYCTVLNKWLDHMWRHTWYIYIYIVLMEEIRLTTR